MPDPTGFNGIPNMRERQNALEGGTRYRWIEAGLVTLNNAGRGTLTYAQPYQNMPVVVCTAFDDAGHSVNAQIDAHIVSGGEFVGVRVQCDRVEEALPTVLNSLFGFLIRRRDNLNGKQVNIIAMGN